MYIWVFEGLGHPTGLALFTGSGGRVFADKHPRDPQCEGLFPDSARSLQQEGRRESRPTVRRAQIGADLFVAEERVKLHRGPCGRSQLSGS